MTKKIIKTQRVRHPPNGINTEKKKTYYKYKIFFFVINHIFLDTGLTDVDFVISPQR